MAARRRRCLFIHLNALQMVFDHRDAVCAQAALSSIADMPIDDATNGEGSKTSTSFLAMQNSAFLAGVTSPCLPRPPKARKQAFGVGVGNAMAIVGHLDRFESTELVVVKYHLNPVRVSVDRVPN